jgi:hypothetical protein
MDRELRTSEAAVLNNDGSSVQFHNALHNGKAQSCAARLIAIASPEAAKYQVPFLL